MKVLLEVRPGEGGDDAKLLVYSQQRMYQKFASRHGLTVSLVETGAS